MGSPVGPASTLQPYTLPKYDEAHCTVDDNSQSSSGVKTNAFNLPTLLTLSGEQVKRINEIRKFDLSSQ